MLEKIQIKGFQKHKKLTVEFDPITTIVGPTDTGKSSFKRAIEFMATNSPSGLDFLNWDSDQVAIRMFIDGHIIIRRKSKKINSYKLDQEEPFEAFGTGVPKQIKELLNLNEANFQAQHDSPFWLSKTSGMISRELNKLVNLEIMDRTLSKLTEYANTASTNQTSIQNRIQSLKQQVEDAEVVEEINIDLLMLEAMEAEKEETTQNRLSLANSLKSIQALVRNRDQAAAAASELGIAMNTARRSGKITIEKELLQRIVGQAQRAKRQVEKRPPDLTGLDKCYRAFKKVNRQTEALRAILSHCEESEESLESLRSRAVQKRSAFEKAMGDTCPLCEGLIERKSNV